LILSLIILFLVPASVSAWTPPHDTSHNITCANCHALHQTSTVGALLPWEAEQEAMCKSCHNPTGQAPTMDTEM
jgi:predicted CXXCH cytochrome family protein